MKKSKKLLLVVLFIILVISLLLGVTYAIIEFTKTSNENSVTTGRIKMSYTEPSNALIIDNALPISDEQGKKQTDYFEFRVSSSATTNNNSNIGIKIPYEVNISSIDIDEGKELLTDDEIKLYLTKVVNGEEEVLQDSILLKDLVKSTLRENSIKIYEQEDIHKNGSEEIVTTYRLRVWIDNDTDLNNISNKQYKFRVNVNANAKVTTSTEVTPDPGFNATETVSNSWKSKATNYKNYKSLLITNSKVMPETYTYNNVVYTKQQEIDVSENGDNNIILGEYKDASGNLIALMGADGGILAPEDSSYLFSGMNVTSLDLTYLDTSNATDINHMFYNCLSLKELDLLNFDTSNTTNMWLMFSHCEKLTSLNISSFDTSKVTDMSGLFAYCKSLKALDVSALNTSNVIYINAMFEGCSSLESIELSTFDTSKVVNMQAMFANCYKLESLDLTNFDTSSATNMSWMFANDSLLKSVKVGCKWKIASNSTSMFSSAGTSSVTKVCE